mmetsp:Transcript_37031/g.37351  ORF Transcript_37031/g.37351 Transcript_37031/m.37351 type:complete len:118 (+) Transcript_37031:67-420(+)
MGERASDNKIPVVEGCPRVGLIDDTRSNNRITNELLKVFDLFSPSVNVDDDALSITLAMEFKTAAFILGFDADIASDNHPSVKYASSKTAFMACGLDPAYEETASKNARRDNSPPEL